MPDENERRSMFRALHESGCFVMPNPWDIGTAKYLQHLGFRALATTSGGFAFSRGLPDAEWAVTRDAMLSHIAEIVAATDLPVNADFESGYAHEPEEVAENVRLCMKTGVAGLSIEDATGNKAAPLYGLTQTLDRIKAVRKAIYDSGTGVMLTARTECYLVGQKEPFKEALRRLSAYVDAGADVVFAPGVTRREEIEALVKAGAPRPLNVLMSSGTGLKVPELVNIGVGRISVGSSLARTAWGGFIRAAKEMAEQGSFSEFGRAAPYAELNAFFETDRRSRAPFGSR